MQCLSLPNQWLEFWSTSVRSDSCNHLTSFCQWIKWIKLMTVVPERAVFSVALNHNLTLSRIGSARQSNEQAGWIQKKKPKHSYTCRGALSLRTTLHACKVDFSLKKEVEKRKPVVTASFFQRTITHKLSLVWWNFPLLWLLGSEQDLKSHKDSWEQQLFVEALSAFDPSPL